MADGPALVDTSVVLPGRVAGLVASLVREAVDERRRVAGVSTSAPLAGDLAGTLRVLGEASRRWEALVRQGVSSDRRSEGAGVVAVGARLGAETRERLTAEEGAHLLGVSVRRVQQLVKSAQLSNRGTARRILLDRSEVLAMMDRRDRRVS